MQTMLNQIKIRELDESEISLVNGGIALGTGPTGIFSTANLANAVRLGGGLTLLYQSGKLGWDIGSWGYKTYIRYKYSAR